MDGTAYMAVNITVVFLILILVPFLVRTYRKLEIEREIRYRNLQFEPKYYKTEYGFQWPWHPWQLTIFFLLAVENGIFYGIVMQRLWGVLLATIPVTLALQHFRCSSCGHYC